MIKRDYLSSNTYILAFAKTSIVSQIWKSMLAALNPKLIDCLIKGNTTPPSPIEKINATAPIRRVKG